MKAAHTEPTRRLLRTKAAANYLGVSSWTLLSIVQRGELPVVRIGQNAPFLIDIRDLDDWIARHKQTI